MANKENDYIDSFFQDGEDDAAGSEGNAGMSSAFEKAYRSMNAQRENTQGEDAQSENAQPEEKTVVRTAEVKATVPASSAGSKKEGRKLRIAGGVLSWVKEIVVVFLIVWLFITFIAQNCEVVGRSMEPTCQSGDHVIINKIVYRFAEIKRGDIIVFNYEDPEITDEEQRSKEKRLIKRVIGLPGDEIDLLEGKVYINGIVYDESDYYTGTTEINGKISFPYKVPDDSYFVMGDNRADSKDSRYFGAVSKSAIIGEAFFRYWPLDSMGFLN